MGSLLTKLDILESWLMHFEKITLRPNRDEPPISNITFRIGLSSIKAVGSHALHRGQMLGIRASMLEEHLPNRICFDGARSAGDGNDFAEPFSELDTFHDDLCDRLYR